jgi:phosphoribosylaminoimidazole-succinocarboxamide synthase
MEKQELYRGKAKTVYTTDDPNLLVMHYRDDTSAFDGERWKASSKGRDEQQDQRLHHAKARGGGRQTHFLRLLNERDSLVRALKMLPVECVVRTICAGSMAKRLGIPEGTVLPEPIFEFFYKSDPLKDPLVNDDHIRVLGWATAKEIAEMKTLTLTVNSVLKPLFASGGMDLVDYKLEFGHALDDPHGPLLLGDEFTPDGCRLWDQGTQEKLDKDRFRRNLGNVIGKYREVAQRSARPCSSSRSRQRAAWRRRGVKSAGPRPAFNGDRVGLFLGGVRRCGRRGRGRGGFHRCILEASTAAPLPWASVAAVPASFEAAAALSAASFAIAADLSAAAFASAAALSLLSPQAVSAERQRSNKNGTSSCLPLRVWNEASVCSRIGRRPGRSEVSKNGRTQAPTFSRLPKNRNGFN